MVKRPKKFVTVDDISPAVARAKSREQLVPRLLIRYFFAVSLQILASSRFLRKISSLCYLGLQYSVCHDYHLEYKHKFLKLQLNFVHPQARVKVLGTRLAAAEPREELLAAILYEPADFRGKQLTKNYHDTRGQTR